MKLKPSTTYNFSGKDLAFVNELAKIGYIHLCSSQVLLMSANERDGINFKDYGNETMGACEGLVLPENWNIEGIYHDEKFIKVTFGVAPVIGPEQEIK
jgi:hypothetical protein